jgi:Zn finger protein HypA/HybF involved in hydrogenase expression
MEKVMEFCKRNSGCKGASIELCDSLELVYRRKSDGVSIYLCPRCGSSVSVICGDKDDDFLQIAIEELGESDV